MHTMKFVDSLKVSWQTIVVLMTPIILCPLVFPYSETSPESKCASLIALMAVLWITESLPMPVTSLLPIAICPLLGIASSKQMCLAFFGDISFLLLGGIFVAIAIEESQLHKRLALKILMTIGVQPRRLMLGIMLTTAFLSMWISNTATTAMMMPITRAILAKLFSASNKHRLISSRENVFKDQGASTGEGHAMIGDAMASYNVNVVVVHNARTDFIDNSSPAESIELRNLTDVTISVSEISSEHHEGLKGQADQMSGEHHLVQHGKSDQHCDEVYENGIDRCTDNKKADIPTGLNDEEMDIVLKNLDPQNLAILKAFSLCVCYSANIGGMATLTGTTPNMVLSRMAADMSKTNLINFANWFGFGLPVSIITLLGCYIWMNIYVFGFRNTLTCKSITTEEEVTRAVETVKQEYKSLGKIRFNEVIVMIHFLVLVALWLTLDPGTFKGWAVLFKSRYVTDGTIAMIVGISLFIFPKERPNVLFFRRKGDKSPARSTPSILTWKKASQKFPWGVMLLLGGGFALSEASKVSGFSKVLANHMLFIRYLPVWAATLVVTALTSLLTEITSNTVIVMLVLPILKDISQVFNVNPLIMMLPSTLAASLAFMLPVATGPNSLVFAYGDIKTIDMIKAGSVMNVIGVLAIVLAINTWGYINYNLGTVPLWALPAGSNDDAANFTGTSLNYINFTVTSSTSQ